MNDATPVDRLRARLARASFLASALLLSNPLLPAPASAEPWSVARVLEAARANDPALAAARAAGDAGRAQASMTWAQLSPHVTLGGGLTRTDDPAVLFSQKLWQGRFTPADFAIDALNQPAPATALQWSVTVDQPLWNGGRELMTPGLAARYGRAATAMERASVANRLLAAVEAWVDAVSARENAKAAAQALEFAQAMRLSAAERFRAGQVPEVDTLRAAARASDARVRELGARRQLAVRMERLSKLVGAPVAPDELDAGDAPAPRRPTARAANSSRCANPPPRPRARRRRPGSRCCRP